MLAAAAWPPRAAHAAPRTLTLAEALAMARRSNPTLVAERAHLSQARTNIEQAWAALFPTVTAQGRYARNNIGVSFPLSVFAQGASGTLVFQPLNQLDGTVNATVPLLAPAAYPALRASEMSADAAGADYQTAQANLLYAVAQAYYSAAIADEVITARQSSIEVARATLHNAETRFAAGTVTKVDVDRAELAVVSTEQSLREARLADEQSYRALATLIGSDGPFRVEPLAPPQADRPDQDFDLQLVLRLRPEFRALNLLARAQLAQDRAFAWRWAPSLAAFGNAHIFNYDNFAEQRYAWAVGLELDWVLYDGGARDAQRHLAAAQAQETMARAEVLSDSIRDDLANSQGALDTKRHAQDAAARSVSLAMETLDLVRTQYQAGSVTQIELLQAQDNLVAAQEALARSHFDVAMADLTLRRAAGTFPGP